MGERGQMEKTEREGGKGDAKHMLTADHNQTNHDTPMVGHQPLHQEYAPLDFEGKPGDVLTACSVRDAQGPAARSRPSGGR